MSSEEVPKPQIGTTALVNILISVWQDPEQGTELTYTSTSDPTMR